jgi:hypothetical protein
MNPNHIDKLAAAETMPGWLPWVLLAVFAVGLVGSLLLYVRWKGRDFRRDSNEAWAKFESVVWSKGAPHIHSVLEAWERVSRVLPDHSVWVRVVPPTGYDNELRKARKPGQSIDEIFGTVSGPRHEYGARWVTQILGGQTDVYTVTVRDRDADPSGARALAHELGAHLWPKLRGEGWNLDHSNEAAAEVAAELEGVLK